VEANISPEAGGGAAGKQRFRVQAVGSRNGPWWGRRRRRARAMRQMRCNFWIEVDSEVALSEWRVALLEAVAETGSISAAAERMDVHFRVAWRKIREMEARLGVRLVVGTVGGTHGGGARLTQEAHDTIGRFRQFVHGLHALADKQYREAFGEDA
jgi:molybdate transport system regulatory protein